MKHIIYSHSWLKSEPGYNCNFLAAPAHWKQTPPFFTLKAKTSFLLFKETAPFKIDLTKCIRSHDGSIGTTLRVPLFLPLIAAGSFQFKKIFILHATLTEVETLNLPSSSSPIRGEIKSHKKFKCKIFFNRKLYNCVCLFLTLKWKSLCTYLHCGVLTLAGEGIVILYTVYYSCSPFVE